MIFLLGGASRSGKSIVARRVTQELGIAHFPIDFLIGALKGYDSVFETDNHILGQPKQPFMEKAQTLWSATKGLIETIEKHQVNYLVEGDTILPAQVASLKDNLNFKVCFMGFAQQSVQEKLEELKSHRVQGQNWTDKYTEEEVQNIITDRIKYSQYLMKECSKYEMEYFDSSKNFEVCNESVFNFIKKSLGD